MDVVKDMSEEDIKQLFIKQQKHAIRHVGGMRSQAEVLARYNLDCDKYKEVKASGDVQQREYLHDIYNELKVLGWILKKPDQQITRDANK
ncbi:MAG: hypothetical protein PUI81_08475 [Veillonellaceae bacterium]|nr:hypothetical protein [Veillonellaceae bacterium]MDD6924122.1 hypothetical protein [Veillonellaceae bacterium]